MTDLEELFERLEQAVVRLAEVYATANDPRDQWRLVGKMEGVRLAQSYIDEMQR